MNARLDEILERSQVQDEDYHKAEARRVQPGSGGASPASAKTAKAAKGKSEGDAERPDTVEVTIRSIHTSAAQSLQVKVAATIGDVKEALANALGRPEVLNVKLLRRNNDSAGYTSLLDDEVCGSTRQFFIMNVDLEPAPGAPLAKSPEDRQVVVRKELPELFPMGAILSIARSTLLREGEGLDSERVLDLEPGQLCAVRGHGAGKRLNVELLPELGQWGWLTAATKSGEVLVVHASEQQLLALRRQQHPPETVMVTVAPATGGGAWVELFVLDSLTFAGLKESLAASLGRPAVLQRGRFVQRKGAASFAGIRDEEFLGDRRDFLYMGTDLTSQR